MLVCVIRVTVERKQNALAGLPAAKSVVGGDVSAHGRVFRNAVQKDNLFVSLALSDRLSND